MSRLWTAALWLLALAASAWAAPEQSLSTDRFGPVKIYGIAAHPRTLILSISGREGWGAGETEAARSLADLGYLVAGIDLKTYFESVTRSKESCVLVSLDLENLGGLIQKKFGLAGLEPILAGFFEGASLAYAAVTQARPGVFGGALGVGFCPSLEPPFPLCRGNALQWKETPQGRGLALLPCPTLDTPWIVLNGRLDPICGIESARTFVSLTCSSQLVELGGTVRAILPLGAWMPQFTLALRTLSILSPVPKPAAENLEDLPLVEVPAPGSDSDILVVDITGDGGYGTVDRGISEGLAQSGLPVISLNSLKYFWTKKTPEIAAKDLERILRHYLNAWKKSEIVVVGYSLGGDVAPFMISRLPEDLRKRVKLLALLGPSRTVNFKFHLMDWLKSSSRTDDLPVIPELQKLENVAFICFYGTDDKANICGEIRGQRVKSVPLEGGHRFGRNYERVLRAVLEEVKGLSTSH